MRRFELPLQVRQLVDARNALKAHYADVDLRFTFDGNLVGDLGEAVAAELFNLKLTGRSNEGIDGFAKDGRSVQVKASGVKGGPAFRVVDTRADHLIVLHFDYDACAGEVIYNGPEEPVIRSLPPGWAGQRCVSIPALNRLDALVEESSRLPMRNAEF
ncbi:MAG: hypothetical protein EOP66_14665 [Sphingomonas sp.]|nr:MAG: hypothetical protein EOP66_14665 [Sphingomonas sp.]